ncbi:CoA transferase [Bordetella tumulicola]
MFGPFASRWLADYGADVIKVESPEGDSTRTTGVARERGLAGSYITINRNKRSVVLNLKQAAGRDALFKLLDGADVFMHNIRPQKIRALGLDSETIRTRFPRLICVSLTGFSEVGPYSGRPAYDDIIQGMCGLADLMRRQTDEMQYLPTVAADKISGLVGGLAILTALWARERTGEGQAVEVPMFESMVDFTLLEHRGGNAFVPPESGIGYARVLARWRRPYRTLDGYVCLMPYTTAQWERFFTEIGKKELAVDSRFQSMASRTQHIEALYAIVGDAATTRTSQDWLDTCQRLDIPSGPITDLDRVLDDPHLNAVGFFQDLPEADNKGSARLSTPGVRFNGQLPVLHSVSRLGQDTRQVLKEAGLDEGEIEALLSCGAAYESMPQKSEIGK